jgi:hypothetical protein
MARRGRLIAGVALAATTVAVFAVPAAGGPPPPTTMKISKHKHGPFKDKILTDTLSLGASRDYYFKVTNSTGNPQEVTLVSFLKPTTSYEKTWFKGHKNITDDVYGVAHDGYTFTIRNKPKLFRGRVKKTDGPSATCMGANLYTGMTHLRFQGVAIDNDSACF